MFTRWIVTNITSALHGSPSDLWTVPDIEQRLRRVHLALETGQGDAMSTLWGEEIHYTY
jgi:hypothetical protein